MREVKWMACANRGFYVHLSTLAEVRERVLEHVNVLARPLVLQREKHPVVWTPVYANITVCLIFEHNTLNKVIAKFKINLQYENVYRIQKLLTICGTSESALNRRSAL